MSFVFSAAEVSISVILIGISGGANATMPTAIAERFSGSLANPRELASALGLILMLFQILAITISERILKSRAEAITGI
jgi:ABC-type Fe3+ transport system permease subunit